MRYAAYGAILLAGLSVLVYVLLRIRRMHIKAERYSPHATTLQPFDFQIDVIRNRGKRDMQQDSYYVSAAEDPAQLRSKGLLALVADGMGGLNDGAAVSQIVSDVFAALFADSDTDDPQKLLYEGIYRAETYVDDYLQQNRVQGGTTFVGVIIKGHQLYYSSVGDSYLFHIRKHTIKRLNHAHNYAAMLDKMVRDGSISPEKAQQDPKRAMLTAYVGMGEVTAIDGNSVPLLLLPGDIILICSDGVANALGNDALVHLAQSCPFESLGASIEQAILRQDIPNQDNFTAVLIRCRDKV